jgi:3-dehydroquinate synthase
MEKTTVNLDGRSYPVYFGNNMSGQLPAHLKEKFPDRRFAFVTNATLAHLYKTTIAQWESELAITKIIIPDGEKYKTLSTWESVLDVMLGVRMDRSVVVLAFGGGVVGDIAGFAAACYLRGVNCVQIPTTLLAMVDSSVGGKTGVNHPSGKNLIGAFHQPSMVWIDTAFLGTLPSREFIAGYAEIFKCAFIGGMDMFSFVSSTHTGMMTKKEDILAESIKRSVSIKAAVVEKDEREESGERAKLNFGHTFAHAVEKFYHFSGVLHGEAVLWGIACACDLGIRIKSVAEEDLEIYYTLLKRLPRVQLPSTPDTKKLYEGMLMDKKVSMGEINFVLPAKPGSSVIKNDIAREDVMATLEEVFKPKELGIDD